MGNSQGKESAELDLSGQQNKEVPKKVLKQRQLQRLFLSKNQLLEITDDIVGKLANLEEFYVQENRGLSELPSTMESLVRLRRVNIGSAKLDAYPWVMSNWPALTDLVVRHNPGISEVPAAIGSLASLRSLESQGCSIRLLADDIGNLRSIVRIDLRKNQLTSFAIPYSIVELKMLSQLYLGLVSLPKQIVKLANLTKLYLGSNKIEALLPEIGQLKALQILEVRGNVLSRLPPEIGELSSLIKLDVSQNQLIDLPNELHLLEGVVVSPRRRRAASLIVATNPCAARAQGKQL
nr:hypothetical protein HK105_008079 [Polyrhizophydium stewartii]